MSACPSGECRVEQARKYDSLLGVLERRLHHAGAKPGTGGVKLGRALSGPPREEDVPSVKGVPPLELPTELEWLGAELGPLRDADRGARR